MKPQPHAHPPIKHDAAMVLYLKGYNYAEIARCLSTSRQTVRRWLIAGEKERHNNVIHAYQRKVYKRKGPDPSIGRCKEDVVGMDARIQEHRERILREEANCQS